MLKGESSTFTLELPPYRVPQIGRIIYTSLIDRTLFVLSRAVVVAIPAGVITWLLANITIGDMTILNHIALFLDPPFKLTRLNFTSLTNPLSTLPNILLEFPLSLIISIPE